MPGILDETPRPTRHAGSDWLKPKLERHNVGMSPFGARVADLLGEAAQGIYHIEWVLSATNRPQWSARNHMDLCMERGFLTLDTVDGDDLTRLVFLAHDYGIRLEIRPRTFRHVTLSFSQREKRENSMTGHPTLEQAVKGYRSRYPSVEVAE